MLLKDFETQLNEKLSTYEFRGWGWQGDVFNVVEKLLKDNGIYDGNKLYYHQYDSRCQTLYIRFDQTSSLFCIEVKKKKGKYIPSRWGKGSYEWTFGNCTIFETETCTTVEEAWDKMMKSYKEIMESKDEKRKRAIEVVLYIRKTFGLSSWDAKYFINYMKENWYSFDAAVDKILKEDN